MLAVATSSLCAPAWMPSWPGADGMAGSGAGSYALGHSRKGHHSALPDMSGMGVDMEGGVDDMSLGSPGAQFDPKALMMGGMPGAGDAGLKGLDPFGGMGASMGSMGMGGAASMNLGMATDPFGNKAMGMGMATDPFGGKDLFGKDFKDIPGMGKGAAGMGSLPGMASLPGMSADPFAALMANGGAKDPSLAGLMKDPFAGAVAGKDSFASMMGAFPGGAGALDASAGKDPLGLLGGAGAGAGAGADPFGLPQHVMEQEASPATHAWHNLTAAQQSLLSAMLAVGEARTAVCEGVRAQLEAVTASLASLPEKEATGLRVMAEHVEHMLQRTERALALAEHPTNFTVTGRFAGVPADDLEVELLGRHLTVGVKSEKPKETAAKTPKQQAAAAAYAAAVADPFGMGLGMGGMAMNPMMGMPGMGGVGGPMGGWPGAATGADDEMARKAYLYLPETADTRGAPHAETRDGVLTLTFAKLQPVSVAVREA